MPNDAFYKLCFGTPAVVADLLRGFADGNWVGQMDLRSLRAVPTHFVDESLGQRVCDTVWSVKYRGESERRVYLILEFQSNVKRRMAVRLLRYASMLYEELFDRGEASPKDPPAICPQVIYNGRKLWTARTDIGGPAGIRETVGPGRVALDYRLLDARPERLDVPGLEGNIVAALFRYERNRDVSKAAVLAEAVVQALGKAGASRPRRAFLVWVNDRLPKRFPGETLPEIEDGEERVAMMEARFVELEQQLLSQGRVEGRVEGRMEGTKAVLSRQARRLHGEAVALLFSRWLEACTDPQQLDAAADWIADCDTAEALLARLNGQ